MQAGKAARYGLGMIAFLSLALACRKKSDSSTATIATLNCSSATFTATATSGVAYSATAAVPYTGGNRIGYGSGTGISSTGVTGLTATLQAGTLASGAGNLNYSVTGTPSSSGTANFSISFAGQSCTLALAVSGTSGSSGSISALSCSGAVFSASATAGSSFSGTASVPYSGGDGASYSAGSAISSTGVTGLTATLQAGTLASGAGNLTYVISGTPAAAGTASFAISFGGQSCTLSLTVNSAATSCSSLTGVARLVCLCDAFKALLSSSQISTLQLSYSFSNIKTWSNLPAAMSPRLGLRLGDLSTTQLAAAKAIVQEITGTTANEGYDEVQQVWLADDYLRANGANSDYGSGNYYIAFFGTPSTSGTFEIMETGHHKTVANTYTNGVLVAATPHFEASEPISFTSGSTTYSPITQERDNFVDFLGSLSSSQISTAKTSTSFSDLVLVPGQEWAFPSTHLGLQCSNLSAAQKEKLLSVIKTYTNDIDDANAATILATYSGELDNTYVVYSGTSAMTTKFDYFRIDGPHVWIEFIVAGGVIFPSQTHIHSIWRDRVNDYAGTH